MDVGSHLDVGRAVLRSGILLAASLPGEVCYPYWRKEHMSLKKRYYM